MDSSRRVEHVHDGHVDACSRCLRSVDLQHAPLTCFACDGDRHGCPLQRAICVECASCCSLDTAVHFFVCDVCTFCRMLANIGSETSRAHLLRLAHDSQTRKAACLNTRNPRIAALTRDTFASSALRVLGYSPAGAEQQTLQQRVSLDDEARFFIGRHVPP